MTPSSSPAASPPGTEVARRAVGGLASGRSIATIVVLLVLLVLPPQILSTYWLDAVTLSVIYAAIGLSLGVLVGRVGMISLCQIQLAAVGAWFALRLGYATSLPFPLVLLGAGVATLMIGVLIGLPALRLSGLHLAVITLMAAAVLALVFTNINFPNGGHSLLGNSSSNFTTPTLRKPVIGHGHASFYRYALIVVLVLFGIVWLHLRGAVGRGWAAIRQNEAVARSAGINVNFYKLWGFALAALVAGVGGALVSAEGGITATQFPTQDSITLLAVVLMAGTHTMWGAAIVGVLLQLVPAAFTNWGLNPDLLQVIFGLGVIQVLLQSPTGIAGQLPRDVGRLARWLRRSRPESQAS